MVYFVNIVTQKRRLTPKVEILGEDWTEVPRHCDFLVIARSVSDKAISKKGLLRFARNDEERYEPKQ